MNRNYTLDIVRTLAIVLMVIFHFIYDLKYFAYITWDIPDGQGWQQFRWFIISLFFLCLGISLTFAHRCEVRTKKFLLRLTQIAGAALIISIASYFAIPENWIFFGVLHFLAFASCVVIFFVNKPKFCLFIGCVFIAVGALEVLPNRWPFHLLFEGLPKYTNDYVAIFPWLGMVFIGVFVAHSRWFQNDPLATASNHRTWLVWPGQHSLSIYLLHQPIMMGGLYLLSNWG